MQELCGWIGHPNRASRADDTVARMQAGLTQNDVDLRHTISPGGALVAARASMRTSDAGDLHVAVAGSPWWRDEELQSLADRGDFPRSLMLAYRKHGDDLLTYLFGDFAIAIIDESSQRSLLAVDRFGIHRLCYASADNVIAFGSTLDAVMRFPGVPTDIDDQSVYDYLYFHMIPSPKTIFSGITKLEPGRALRINDGRPELLRYWNPEFSEDRSSAATLKGELHATLRAAVARSSADTAADRVGAFLSGGLDSSTVCGLLAERNAGSAKVYSIGFEQQGYDEMSFARIAAKHFNLDLHEYYVTPTDVADAVPRIAAAYDEPFGNSSAVPAYFCAKMARDDGTKLLLAGDGGDELFAGNERYARQKMFGIYDGLPTWLKRLIVEPVFLNGRIASMSKPTQKIKSYIEQAGVPMPLRLETYNFIQRSANAEMFDAGFIERINVQHPSEGLTRVWQEAPPTTMLNKMLLLDWKITLADNDLRKVNRMCQLAGIDVAYPMLDDELTELSMKIPSSRKLKGFKLRHFFKNSMQDFLPEQIINKSKQGFGLPFGEWLKTSNELQELVYGSLEQLKSREILRPGFIDDLTETHREGHASYYGEFVWVLTMLEQWISGHKSG